MAVLNRRGLVGGVAVVATTALVAAGCTASTSDDQTATNAGNECAEITTVTWLGTIKVEIQEEFKAGIAEYNATNADCVVVDIRETPPDVPFLQTVAPMYEAGNAPTIMSALQEIPDMAPRVMDWTGQPLANLAADGTLDVASIDGKQVGIPVTAEAFGLLYNKDVLDAAGVDPMSIQTRSDLAEAFVAVEATGASAVHFSGLWWSLGAHFSNIYHTDAADTVEGRAAILDELKAGTKDLSADPVFVDWLDTFDLMNEHSVDNASIADTDYDQGVENLATGEVGFWFMGNWAEPNLLDATPDGSFGVMPLPISDNANAYGNDGISVGVPYYIMIDEEQSTQAERDGAIAVLEWFITTPEGQAYWSGPAGEGMGFIPVYDGFTVQPDTYMAAEIGDYIVAGKSLEWVNSSYPAGLQDLYGAAAQKYYDGKTDREQFADELESAWVD